MNLSNDQPVPARKIDYLWAILACVGTMLLTLPLADTVDLANIVMLFLLAVVLVAARLGSGPALLAAFVSVALFDYFFVPPRFTFVVADGRYLITFAVMLAVALVTGQLAARLRAKARFAAAREAETRALYDMAKGLSGAIAAEQVADIVCRFLTTNLGVASALYLPRHDGTLAAFPASKERDADQMHIRAAFNEGRPMQLAAEESGYAPALALPLVSPVCTRGVLLVFDIEEAQVYGAERRPLLDAVSSLAAIAVERMHYSEVAQEVELRMETERLRNALLAAVSHDLRTPLTVLVGQADALTLARAGLPAAARESAAAIRDQALRLSGQVNKLLDMARLQTGKVTLDRAWQPLEEVVGSSLKAMEVALAGREVNVDLATDLPPLEFDAVLLERVLCNLLENAARHAIAGPIDVAARLQGDRVEVAVSDVGPGIPVGEEARIFEIFERGGQKGVTGGVGLGLAICRAIIAAHGGTIAAENREGGGLTVRFTLPVGNSPKLEEDAGD